MALYEHVLIARQDLSTTQAEGLIEHFGQILTDNEGKATMRSSAQMRRPLRFRKWNALHVCMKM